MGVDVHAHLPHLPLAVENSSATARHCYVRNFRSGVRRCRLLPFETEILPRAAPPLPWKFFHYRPTFPRPCLWLGHAPSGPAVYFLPHAVAPLLCEDFLIAGPKFFVGKLWLTRPPPRPAPPSVNFLITYRIAYTRIDGSRTRPHDPLHAFYRVRWRRAL